MDPADVVLLLGDVLLLSLPGLELLLVTFLAEPGIGLIVARARK